MLPLNLDNEVVYMGLNNNSDLLIMKIGEKRLTMVLREKNSYVCMYEVIL